MSRGGRPLRFLAVMLVGWTGARVAVLWYATGRPPALLPALLPIAGSAAIPTSPVAVPVRGPSRAAIGATRRTPPPTGRPQGTIIPDHRLIALALAGLIRFGPAEPIEQAQPLLVSPASVPPLLPPSRSGARQRSRWSGDGWLLLRAGSMRGAGFGAGQLGGSQAGVRIAYALSRSRRVALVGRLDTPLHGKGREAAFGVEWRPTALPVRLVAEERMPLDGGTAAPAAGAIAGLNPTPLAAGFRLEAYGQAGAIDRGGVQGFADGAARATHRLAAFGPFTADLGAGAWGGAQRGAARLDIGPTIGLGFRLGTLPARLTIDWRQRVAGRARPGSGLAVSLGADF